MEPRTLWCRLEPLFHQVFGAVGLLAARYGGFIAGLICLFLIGLSFGMFALRIESDAFQLTISRRGRIHNEKLYYERNFNFISPELSSFIITPKPGYSLLSKNSLDEIVDLQRWIRTFTFEPSPGLEVSLEQFCFKSVDSEAQEPCYQLSVLDCFAEGRVFNIGGEKNQDYEDFYSPRTSYEEFNFQTDFNTSYVHQHCHSWTGTPASSSLIFGEIVFDESSSQIKEVGALQVGFGTRSPESLHRRGLEYVDWEVIPQSEESAGTICPDVSRCESCADALDATRFLRAGCQIGSTTQPESCCEEMRLLRESPCVDVIFERVSTAREVGNPLLSACGVNRVELSARCTNHLSMHQTRQTSMADNLEEGEDSPGQEVCECLRNQSALECSRSAGTLLASYPESSPLMMGDNGSEASEEETARLLEDIFKCGEDLIPTAETAPVSETPEVCVCLSEPDSADCTRTATAFATQNPQYLTTFLAASNGNQTAISSVAEILVNEVGCEPPDLSSSTEVPVSSVPEGQEQYMASVRIVKELTGSVDEAEELLHSWELAWQNAIGSKVQEYKTIEVTWFPSTSLNDAADDAAQAQGPYMAIGYLLVLLYILGYFAFEYKEGRIQRSSVPPTPFHASLCFFSVLLGVSGSFGVISLFSLTSFKATATTMQIVPLLTVGLGVNDLFVLVSALLSVLDRNKDVDKIMFDAMAVGGTSITLSSAANTAAFALGMLSPIPIVMWFSFQMMIGVLIAYLVSLTVIPVILAYSVSSWLKKKPAVSSGLPTIPGAVDSSESKVPVENEELGLCAAERSFTWKAALVLIVIAFIGWFGVSIVGITQMGQGLDLSEAVEKDTDLYDYLVDKEDYFQSYSVNIVFNGDQDFSDPEIFKESRQAEFTFLIDGYKTDQQAGVLSWFDFYSSYVESKVCSNEVCLNEVNWYYDSFLSSAYEDPRENLCFHTNTVEECRSICESHCPQGPITSKYRCELSRNQRSCYCPWRPVLKPYLFYESPKGFDSKIESYWSDFLTNTSMGLAARNLINFDQETITEKNLYGIPKAARSLASVNDMLTTSERLRHIKRSRTLMDNSSVEVYPFDYIVYALGEQYDHMTSRTITAVAISLALTTAVMIPLIASWRTALIVTFCIGTAIVLSTGTAHWLNLKLNYASFVSLIVAVGLTLEFCAHIARDFMLAEGNRVARSKHALRVMGVAVLNGGLTTFLGILPVAFSSYGYFKKYYFLQYTIVVSVGLLTGLILLPVILSLIGPPSFMATFVARMAPAKVDRKMSVP